MQEDAGWKAGENNNMEESRTSRQRRALALLRASTASAPIDSSLGEAGTGHGRNRSATYIVEIILVECQRMSRAQRSALRTSASP